VTPHISLYPWWGFFVENWSLLTSLLQYFASHERIQEHHLFQKTILDLNSNYYVLHYESAIHLYNIMSSVLVPFIIINVMISHHVCVHFCSCLAGLFIKFL